MTPDQPMEFSSLLTEKSVQFRKDWHADNVLQNHSVPRVNPFRVPDSFLHNPVAMMPVFKRKLCSQ